MDAVAEPVQGHHDRGEQAVAVRRIHEHFQRRVVGGDRAHLDQGATEFHLHQRGRLPGQLLGTEAQEALVRHAGELTVDDGVVVALDVHQRAGGLARLLQALGHRQRMLQAFAQGAARGEVQVGQQPVLPRIPQLGAGAGDVGAGQQVQIIQALAVADQAGEAMDHLRIGDVLLLRGHRHAQMLLDQPGDQLGVGGAERVRGAERARIHRTQLRMVAAAALGDVVEQAGQQQQFRLAQPRPDFVGDGEAFVGARVGEHRHVLQHHQRVLVDRVHVEQVELHAPGHLRERRDPLPEHAQPRHPGQRLHRARAAQQRQEALARGRAGAGVGRQMRQRLGQRARGQRMQAADLAVRGPGGEQREHLHRIGLRPALVVGSQIATAQGEAAVQRLRLRFAVELFLEALQQPVAEPAHDRRAAIEALHHLFDAQALDVVGEAQALRQGLLVIEAQALFRTVGDQVQPVAQARQFAALAAQRGGLVAADMAQPDQRLQIAHAERAQRHPAQRMQVAQAAGAVLDIRLQVVGGVAEALVAGLQFLALGHEEFARRPYPLRGDGRRQRRLGGGVGLQRARLDQRGQHGLVGAGRGALRGRAHRMAHRHAGVPQQWEQPCQRRFAGRIEVAEHQQVDVRAREQFATAVAADREQRQPGLARHAAAPGVADQLVQRARAQRQQAIDVIALVETLAQPRIGLRQQLPDRGGPTGVVDAGTGHAGIGTGRQQAHGSPRPPGDRVRTSTPSSVTATMCSHCAESLRSLVTTVQPSGSTRV
ncbi:hypothetical protein NB717_003543 [Xanthomonas sacchari]|nr:hypothetical protein [Xanthomonas sacchari]